MDRVEGRGPADRGGELPLAGRRIGHLADEEEGARAIVADQRQERPVHPELHRARALEAAPGEGDLGERRRPVFSRPS